MNFIFTMENSVDAMTMIKTSCMDVNYYNSLYIKLNNSVHIYVAYSIT